MPMSGALYLSLSIFYGRRLHVSSVHNIQTLRQSISTCRVIDVLKIRSVLDRGCLEQRCGGMSDEQIMLRFRNLNSS